MVKLIALPPCGDLLPVTVGAVTLSETVPDRLMSVAPFKGKDKAVAGALREQIGADLPKVNRRNGAVTWFGHGVWMVSGQVDLTDAAVTDQTDAWAVVTIAGDGVADVLARLVPVDLRSAVFKKNHVAKTMLGHMSVTIVRADADAFEIMVMRSMAQTLIHELEVAMRGVAGR